MDSLNRYRALDSINSTKSEWLTYNPLFYRLIPEFDESFDRGVGINLKYYVERKDNFGESFETRMCNNVFTTHKLKSGKVYNLSGGVGSGKTSMCKYLREKLLPKMEGAIGIYLDVWPTEIKSLHTHQTLNKLLLNATFASLKHRGIYEKPKDFWKDLAISLGFDEDELSASELLKMSKSFTYEEIVEYLKTQEKFKNILVIIDNIDESNETTIKACRTFSLDIAKYTRSFGNRHFSILLPAREYTISRYFNQEHFAHIELPPINESAVVISKLTQAKDSIAFAFKPQKLEIEYSIPKYPRSHSQYKTVKITKEGSIAFISDLIEHMLSENQNAFYILVRALANKNLKILIGNMYNFIHSCYLPSTKLFEKTIVPKELQNYKERAEEISFNLTLSCLFGIHYPFYDVDNSHLINVFNLSNSGAINDYKNTLTITRFLCYLNNTGEASYSDIINDFSQYGYQKEIIKKAVNKCFNYGLIVSDYGCTSKTLTLDSKIRASSISQLYIQVLITRLFYLGFVVDDVPMPAGYYFDIEDKYSDRIDETNRTMMEKMINTVSTLLDFIKSEEELEKRYITEVLHKDYSNFTNKFGVIHNSKPLTLGEYIGNNWNKDEYQKAPTLKELRQYI